MAAMNISVNGNPVSGSWVTVTVYLGSDGVYVASGTSTDGKVYLQTSTDGVTWTRQAGEWPF